MEDLSIINDRLRSEDEEERRRAVIALFGHPLADARKALFTAMGDESWRVRKEAVNLLLSMSPDAGTIEGLIALLRSADNAGLRNSAVEAFERLGSMAVPTLLGHCLDADRDVRKFVIDILGNIGDRSAIPSLVGALRDSDANVCAAAAENLGKIGDPGAVPPLLEALVASDVWFRYSVLEALGRIAQPVPFAALAPLAVDNLLKRAVFECLGTVGDAEAVPLLVDGLDEKVRATREAAALALMRIRRRLTADGAAMAVDAVLAGRKGTSTVEGILASLETSDHAVKEALVGILGIIGDERAAGALLSGCRDERLKRHCLQAFRAIGEKGMFSLMDAFSSADDEERTYIVHIFGETGFTGCEQILGEGMQSSHPLLRRVSATAAGAIGAAGLVGEIERLLGDADPDVCEAAVRALARLAPADRDSVLRIALALSSSDETGTRRDSVVLFTALRDADRLALLIKDESPLVRRSAVSALAGLRLPECLGNLAMALVDEDPDVRIAAAGGLGEVGETAVKPLVLSLNDEDPWVQCAALKSLGKLGGEKAIEAIERLLDASSGVVLITALDTLSVMEGGRSLPLVKRALDNSDEEVVKAAIDILSRDGTDWIAENREKLMAHPHWDVRGSFVRAMVRLLGQESIPYLQNALETEPDELVRGQIRDALGRFQ